MRELLTTSPIWFGAGSFVGRIISFSPMACMCLIWLNMYLLSWRLVLMISLSMRDVITCTLLQFTVSWWLDMDSKTCWGVVGYFLPMLSIQTLVLFLAGNSWLHGLLFYYLEMYEMLWCSQYCVTIIIGFILGGKLTLTSNISYLINGWSDIFS